MRWVLVLLCLCVTSGVDAQHKPRSKKATAQAQHSDAPTKRVKRKTPSKKKLAPKTEAQLPQTPAPEQKATTPPSDATPTDPSQIRTEGDTQVKVMEFSGLDIEGQLKTPQMLYFLNRLRAEFGHPSLPHRSFMPELQQATETDAFR